MKNWIFFAPVIIFVNIFLKLKLFFSSKKDKNKKYELSDSYCGTSYNNYGASQSNYYYTSMGVTSSSAPQINQIIDEDSDLGKDLTACAISNGWIKNFSESTFIWRAKSNSNIDLKEWWIWNKSDVTRYRITDIDYRDYKLSKILD